MLYKIYIYTDFYVQTQCYLYSVECSLITNVVDVEDLNSSHKIMIVIYINTIP